MTDNGSYPVPLEVENASPWSVHRRPILAGAAVLGALAAVAAVVLLTGGTPAPVPPVAGGPGAGAGSTSTPTPTGSATSIFPEAGTAKDLFKALYPASGGAGGGGGTASASPTADGGFFATSGTDGSGSGGSGTGGSGTGGSGTGGVITIPSPAPSTPSVPPTASPTPTHPPTPTRTPTATPTVSPTTPPPSGPVLAVAGKLVRYGTGPVPTTCVALPAYKVQVKDVTGVVLRTATLAPGVPAALAHGAGYRCTYVYSTTLAEPLQLFYVFSASRVTGTAETSNFVVADVLLKGGHGPDLKIGR